MKFNLSNFLQLDTKGLLAVNGGFTCGGSSNSPSESSTSESTGNSNGGSTTTVFIPTGPCNGYLSTKHSKGNGFSDKTGHGSSSGSSGGGSCSTPSSSPDSSSGKSNNPDGQGPSTTSSNPGGNQHKDTKIHSGGGTCTKTGGHSPVNPNPTNPDDVTSGGGTCSGGSSSGGSTGEPVETTNGNGTNDGPNSPSDTTVDGHLICSNPNDFHCDIIAWNHAVDAGLNPRGKDGTDWDANNKTVDQIYNEHFVGLDVDFDGKQAGKMGYILYDWKNDGSYDHIEFGMISADGLSYSFYSNEGFEKGEFYDTRTFEKDSNAGALNGGPGKVRFIPLN